VTTAQGEAVGVRSARADRRRGYWSDAWRHLLTERSSLIGLAIVLLLLAAAIFAPWIAPHPPERQFREGLTDLGQPLGPSATFPLGTDELGRDVLSRIIFGARVSLVVGLVGNLLAAAIAFVVGGTAAMLRGRGQNVIMRGVDVVLSFPVLLFAIALFVIASPGLESVTGIVALSFGAYLARIVYSAVMSLREREFVIAAEAAGVGRAGILVRHILPHLIPILLIFTTLSVAAAIQLEAVFSFVGIGVQPPTASWGNMIASGETYLFSSPMLVLAPGSAIVLALLGFTLLGDGLRDALDPSLARTRRMATVR
jgi:peptide/nickel transport system permease protein